MRLNISYRFAETDGLFIGIWIIYDDIFIVLVYIFFNKLDYDLIGDKFTIETAFNEFLCLFWYFYTFGLQRIIIFYLVFYELIHVDYIEVMLCFDGFS